MRAMFASLAFTCLLLGCDSSGLWSAPRDHEDGTTAGSGSSTATSGSSGHGSTAASSTGASTGTSGSGSTNSSSSSTGSTGLVTAAEVDVIGTANLGSSATSTYDLAIAPNGTLYASDCGDNALLIFAGGTGSLWAGGTGVGEHHDGQGTSAQLACPYGMVFIGSTLYVMDSGDGSEFGYLRSVDSAANVGTVCGNGQDTSAVNGTCTNAQFDDAACIAADSAGNIYVADKGANTVRRIEHDFSGVSTWAGSGQQGFGNGEGLQATFGTPMAVAVDANGDVFVADYANNAIREIDPNQNVTTFAVDPDLGAELFGVAVDSAGNVYASDANNRHILRWNANGTLTARITDSALGEPACMKIGPDGKLWVADLNSGILKISL